MSRLYRVIFLERQCPIMLKSPRCFLWEQAIKEDVKMLLDGKVAVVTGSSKGLGRAFAMGLAKEGASVIVNGTSAEDVARVVEEIKKGGGKAVPCVASVATMAGAESIINTAVKQFGRLDVLVNNAGIVRDRTFLKMTEQEWDEVIAVHLRGTFTCCKAAAPVMIQQGGGRIMTITSGAAFLGNVGQSNYSAAKAGIIGLSLSLCQELSRYNINVNVVWPRALTRMTEPIAHKMMQKNQSQEGPELTPLDIGLGSPEMVAPLVVYLASDAAKGINGKIIGLRGEILSVWSQHKELATATRVGGWTPQEIAKRLPVILERL